VRRSKKASDPSSNLGEPINFFFNSIMEFKVTPWEVRGKINYEKLIDEFGVQKIDSKLLDKIESLAGELHFMLKRKIFFAHRDLNWVLEEYEKGNKFFLYTGRAPSGPVHIGHLLPWIFTKWLQDRFDVELWFQFPDEEKFLFKKNLEFEEIEKCLEDNILDVIAIGFDPERTNFIINTKHASLLYKQACRIAKRITFSMVKSSFGLNEQSNIGSIFYTAMQAVPAFLPCVLKNKKIPCLIPHAIDQDPHFRLTRDIMPKLGYYKPASIQCSFLPPLTGVHGKMSASERETAIYLTDGEETVREKIMKHAFSGGQPTAKEHRKKGGIPEIDVCYQWLRYLFEPDDKKLEKIYYDYKSGKLLTGELKEILIKKITDFLKEHNSKKKKAKKNIDKYLEWFDFKFLP